VDFLETRISNFDRSNMDRNSWTNDSLKAIAYIYLRPFSLLYLRRITEDVLACKSVLIVYGLV